MILWTLDLSLSVPGSSGPELTLCKSSTAGRCQDRKREKETVERMHVLLQVSRHRMHDNDSVVKQDNHRISIEQRTKPCSINKDIRMSFDCIMYSHICCKAAVLTMAALLSASLCAHILRSDCRAAVKYTGEGIQCTVIRQKRRYLVEMDSQKSVGGPDESVWQMVWQRQQMWAQPNIQTDQEELLLYRVNSK